MGLRLRRISEVGYGLGYMDNYVRRGGLTVQGKKEAGIFPSFQ